MIMVSQKRGTCSSAPRPPDHAPTSRSLRTAGRMAGPDNGSSPPWGGSTNCNRVANSTPCWSRARLAQSVLLLSAHAKGQLPTITTRRIGPALIFERLWRETGCQRVIEQLLDGRRFEFDVERAVFLTVLHRLFAPGSDRAADKWRADYQIDGCELLQLYHLYRAMAWLGEELPARCHHIPIS